MTFSNAPLADAATNAAAASRAAPRIDAGLTAILAAAFVGAILVFTAGFANSGTMHDAAHDSRHSIAFPCH